MSKEQLSKLKKENDELKTLVDGLSKQLEELKKNYNPATTGQSIQFLSDEYDDFKTTMTASEKKLKEIEEALSSINTRLEKFDETVEGLLKYSFQYNLKIVGIEQKGKQESAEETVQICLNLFKAIGAKVQESDIDIGHRVKARNTRFPPPIICKFTRRLAKESVMKNKKNIGSINLDDTNFSAKGRIGIYDHLTPTTQNLFHEAKVFQKDNNYAFCWTKNGEVLLRKSDDSRIIRVTDSSVLAGLPSLNKDSVGSPPHFWSAQSSQQQFERTYSAAVAEEQYSGPRLRSSNLRTL